MTHAQLVKCAVDWLRRYRCVIVLSEQTCASGEIPDAIGWKGACRSVVVECKTSRADFLADREKPFRRDPTLGMGCERYYLTPDGLLGVDELPPAWGLLLWRGGKVRLAHKSKGDQRSDAGLMYEMNLLLASLRRVEIRLGSQTVTEFLQWKNRLTEYNGGKMPQGLSPEKGEENLYLQPVLSSRFAD